MEEREANGKEDNDEEEEEEEQEDEEEDDEEREGEEEDEDRAVEKEAKFIRRRGKHRRRLEKKHTKDHKSINVARSAQSKSRKTVSPKALWFHYL